MYALNFYPFHNCYIAPECQDSELQVVNGIVQICYNSLWTNVCGDNGWRDENGRVVCRELGYSEKGKPA